MAKKEKKPDLRRSVMVWYSTDCVPHEDEEEEPEFLGWLVSEMSGEEYFAVITWCGLENFCGKWKFTPTRILEDIDEKLIKTDLRWWARVHRP